MAVYVPNGSEVAFLEKLRTQLLQGGTLHLYTSNYTPAQGDTAATYAAIEATFGGYAAITCNAWGVAYLNGSNLAETDETLRTFVANGSGLPQTVYGVYYLDAGGGLLFAELNPTGGVTLSAAGQSFSYLPVLTLQTV